MAKLGTASEKGMLQICARVVVSIQAVFMFNLYLGK